MSLKVLKILVRKLIKQAKNSLSCKIFLIGVEKRDRFKGQCMCLSHDKVLALNYSDFVHKKTVKARSFNRPSLHINPTYKCLFSRAVFLIYAREVGKAQEVEELSFDPRYFYFSTASRLAWKFTQSRFRQTQWLYYLR